MGMVKVDVATLADGKIVDDWFTVVPQKSGDSVSGQIRLCMQLKIDQKVHPLLFAPHSLVEIC